MSGVSQGRATPLSCETAWAALQCSWAGEPHPLFGEPPGHVVQLTAHLERITVIMAKLLGARQAKHGAADLGIPVCA